jgi:hypothetical protein
MRRRRDRQKLRQALDKPQDDDLEPAHAEYVPLAENIWFRWAQILTAPHRTAPPMLISA